MADTNFIKTEIEPVIGALLEERYGQPFKQESLPVGIKPDGTPRMHEFDAVSRDGTIVAGIKSSTGKTSGGRRPAAKIAEAYKEIYFLCLVHTGHKLLVLTDPDFYEILVPEFAGLLPPRSAIIHLALPPDLQEKMDELKGRTD